MSGMHLNSFASLQTCRVSMPGCHRETEQTDKGALIINIGALIMTYYIVFITV